MTLAVRRGSHEEMQRRPTRRFWAVAVVILLLCLAIAATSVGIWLRVCEAPAPLLSPVLGVTLDGTGRCVCAYRLEHPSGQQQAQGSAEAGGAAVCWEVWTTCSAEDFEGARQRALDEGAEDVAASTLLLLGEPTLYAASVGLPVDQEDCFGPLRYHPGIGVKRQQPDKRRRFSSNSVKASASTFLPSSSSASQASSASRS